MNSKMVRLKAGVVIVCLAALGACGHTDDVAQRDPGKSTCVQKMQAGQPCGAPNLPPMICQDGKPAPAGDICPEDQTFSSLGGSDPVFDCKVEYFQCKDWCNAYFCWALSPACYACVIQCSREFNLCKLGAGPVL
jgi:hypothetical protein